MAVKLVSLSQRIKFVCWLFFVFLNTRRLVSIAISKRPILSCYLVLFKNSRLSRHCEAFTHTDPYSLPIPLTVSFGLYLNNAGLSARSRACIWEARARARPPASPQSGRERQRARGGASFKSRLLAHWLVSEQNKSHHSFSFFFYFCLFLNLVFLFCFCCVLSHALWVSLKENSGVFPNM